MPIDKNPKKRYNNNTREREARKMNPEVIKAIREKKKNYIIRKWWNKNGYKVLRVLFFPIWFTHVVSEKICQKLDAREVWSDERAKEIFDYYIPRFCDWDEEKKTFYFFDNGYGWSMCFAKKHLKRKDRRFWDVHRGLFGGQLRKYLINDYQLNDFHKQIGNCTDGWTEMSFKMIEK